MWGRARTDMTHRSENAGEKTRSQCAGGARWRRRRRAISPDERAITIMTVCTSQGREKRGHSGRSYAFVSAPCVKGW